MGVPGDFYLLMPCKGFPGDDHNGIVVEADTEARARLLAGDERDEIAWSSRDFATCVPLRCIGEDRVIIRSVAQP